MKTNPNRRPPNRPGDTPGEGAKLKPKPPVGAPRAATPRELNRLRWLVGSIRERSLAA